MVGGRASVRVCSRLSLGGGDRGMGDGELVRPLIFGNVGMVGVVFVSRRGLDSRLARLLRNVLIASLNGGL